MIIWPLAVLTLTLTAGLGYTIARIEKDKILSEWEARRCNPAIMTVASYFKPPDDPRTATQFSQDNFKFCMKKGVDSAMAIAMAPFMAIFGKQVNASSMMSDSLNGIRGLIATIFEAFMKYINQFFEKFVFVGEQVKRIALHFKMAFNRLSTILLSLVYTGLSIVRGILNGIDMFLKIVVILLGILVALLIVLFFILFPFIGPIIALITSLMVVVTADTASTLNSYRESFCFASGTKIIMQDGTLNSIEKIKVGDILATGKVKAIMTMSGEKTPLYRLDGILVSGSHLVDYNSNWHSVSEDPRAKQTSTIHQRLYCLNTESSTIPIMGLNGQILFKDWEELASEDNAGQYGWGYHVLSMLNENSKYATWKNSLKAGINPEMPLLSNTTFVLSKESSLIPIGNVKIGDIIADKRGFTEVLGILEGETDTIDSLAGSIWFTQLLVENKSGIWERIVGNPGGNGRMLFTESGTFYVIQDNKPMVVRDFTEVGHKQIHRTYPYVSTRINSLRSRL
jgi:hypothetical protein